MTITILEDKSSMLPYFVHMTLMKNVHPVDCHVFDILFESEYFDYFDRIFKRLFATSSIQLNQLLRLKAPFSS